MSKRSFDSSVPDVEKPVLLAPTAEELAARRLSVADLKARLAALGVSTRGLIERHHVAGGLDLHIGEAAAGLPLPSLGRRQG